MALGVPQANPFGNPDAGPSEDEFSIDLVGVDLNPALPAVGQHLARVTNVENVYSSKGDPMITWHYELISGDAAGFKIKNYTVLTEKSLWAAAETLEALGLGKTGQKISFKRTDAINRLALLTISHGTYNNRATANVAKVNPPPDGPGSMAPQSGVPS